MNGGDNLELIIYIIFIAISVLGGLYKNVTKKREEQKRAENTRRQAEDEDEWEKPVAVNPFEEFLKKQFEQFEEPEEEPAPQTAPKMETFNERKPEPVLESRHEPVLDKVEKEGTAAFQKTAETIMSSRSSESIHRFGLFPEAEAEPSTTIRDEIHLVDISVIDTDEESDIAEFDAVNAVVFSEIIRRKEY